MAYTERELNVDTTKFYKISVIKMQLLYRL